MAYGLNFYSEWADNEEFIYRTEILKRDYSGAATEVTSGGAPFVVSLMDDATSDVFHAVRTQKAEIEWVSDSISEFDISDIFITDDQEYKIRFGKIDPGTEDFELLWSGYLTFTDCKEPFLPKPYAVQLAGLCGLALMRDQYFLDENGKFVEGIQSLMDILVMCLAQANLDLQIDVHVGLKSQLSNPIVLSQTYIDSDGLRGMTAYDVLDGILNSVNAFITQQDNRWLIRGIREQQANTIPVYRFEPNGDFIEQTTVTQVVSIGSEELAEANPSYINLLPMSDVMESLAEPYSLVTNVVSPGIPVNLLDNGTFNPNGKPWGINLSNMTGWAHSPEPKGWRYEGTGTPDDPFRFIMIGSVKTTANIVFDSKASNRNHQANTNIWNIPPITIYRDGGLDSYPNIKIKVSGAFRMRDGGRLMIAARLNDGDKDYVQWLDENGTWAAEKKFEKRANIKIVGDTSHNPDEYLQLEDIPLQTFEVTSSKIPDYLNRPGGWIAKLYFSIYPVGVGADTFPEVTNNFSPALWLEDFCVSITTETKFEGEHEYQIDGKKLIRNGDEYEYKTIVADKISINTAHQKRDTFRVMTGYASVGIQFLTESWQRSINGSLVGDPEPLQHLTLRERLRLLCGKRRVLEGTFYGEGVGPANCVANLFDGSGDIYYTITGWNWDVKNRMYQLRIHELDFTPLEEEIITLTDSRNNGRGNRLYTNSGGSANSGSGSNSGSDGSEEIVLDDFDPIEYEILVEDEEPRVFDIGALILSNHVPELLEAKILNYPEWISEITFYRGEDLDPDSIPEGGILQVHWIGKPLKSGPYQINIELVGPDAEDYILVIPIIVEPSEDFIEEWPPVFVDLPPLYFIAGKPDTKELFLGDYFDPDGLHDGTGLNVKLLSKPGWVSDTRIVNMDLSVTGTSPTPGTEYITYEFYDAAGRTSTFAFAVITLDPAFLTYKLLEIASGFASEVGALPGSYPVIPRGDVEVRIKADHTKYKIFLKGGGPNGDLISKNLEQEVIETVDGKYRFFLEDNGAVLPVGQYSVSADVYTGESISFVYGETIDFVLYDEAFLDLVKFFLTTGGSELGEIIQDGTSSFIDPGASNISTVIDGISHDGATVEILQDDVAVGSKSFTHGSPVTDETYVLFDEDIQLEVGKYTTRLFLTLAGDQIAMRYANFEIVKDKPETTGGLDLITMISNTTDYTILAELPENGSSNALPTNWGLLVSKESPEFKYESSELFELKAGALVNVDVALYTRQPEYNQFTTAVIKSDYLLFRGLSSLNIGKIHGSPKTFRAVVTRRVEDATSEIVDIIQADFSFGPSVPIDDETPIEEPGAGNVDYVARRAMEEEIIDSIKHFDVITDDLSVGVNEDNELEVVNKGITFPKLLDVPGQTLIGKNTAGTGTPFAVPIRSVLDSFSDGIPDVTAVKDAIAAVQTSTYIDWNLVNDGKFKLNTNPVNSPTGNATHGLFMPHYNLPGYGTAFAIRNNAFWFRSVENGVWQTWLQVADRAWVNAKQIISGTGLSGGGDLSTNRTLSVLYGTTAGTSAQGNDPRLNNGQTANDRWISTPVNYTDINAITKGGVTAWGNTAANRPESFGTILNFVGGSNTGDVVGGGFVSQLMSGTSGNWFVRYGQTGTIYQMWTTKQFSSTQVSNWDTVASRSVTAGIGLTGGSSLLAGDPSIALGTPSTITNATTNSVSGTTHTHALQVANLVAGSNVSLSASGTGVILGSNNITINVGTFPWTGLTGKPTTLDGFGITDVYKIIDVDLLLTGKENTFAKGSLIQGAGIALSGTLTNRLVGTGDVTVALGTSGVSAGTYRSVTVDVYGRVTGGTNPNTLAGYGLDSTVYTKSQVDALIPSISGTTGYLPKFTSSTDLGNSPVMDTGSEINIANTRSLGVEGPAAMRNYLHVWGYQSNGTASSHGSIVVHNAASATADASAAIEIRSTTKGLLLPRMTSTQRAAISDTVGLMVWQTDAAVSGAGVYVSYGSGAWVRLMPDL